MPRARATAAATDTASPVPHATYERVPLRAIVESPLNPRKHIDEAKLVELVESIRQHGIIEPIVLRRMPNDIEPDDVVYEVVAGARRTRAARLAGLVDVPAMIRVVTDTQLLELALQENIHQATMSALDEARALAKLAELDPIYRDDRVLASTIGRSETYVRDRRKLLRLDAIVQDALEGGAITSKHAERIARLPVDQHRAALEACFARIFLLADDRALAGEGSTEDGPEPDDITALIHREQWDRLAPALVGLRKFDEWAESHAKLDVAAPEVQQQLVEQLADDAEVQRAVDQDDDEISSVVAAATAEMLQLSSDFLDGKAAAAMGVLPAGQWKPIVSETDRCAFAQRALIVHGDADHGRPRTAPELVDVCVARRKCQTHWPKAPTSKASGGGYDHAAENKKRAEAHSHWEAVKPRYVDALRSHTRKLRFGAKLVRMAVTDYGISEVETTFGVKLSDQTAAQVLALQTVNDYSLETFERAAKALGLDVAKLAKATAPPAVAGKAKKVGTSKPAKKAAKAKPAKKAAAKGKKR